MGSLIENCPTDIIGEIINLLEPDAICNLRLSCKTLAIKSSSLYSVKALFRLKNVELTEQALLVCAARTQAGGLCCLLEELTLMCFAGSNDAPRPTPLGGVQLWRKHKEYLLSQSFIALKRNGPTGRLASLSLRVEVPPDVVNESAGYIRRLMWEEPAVDIFLTTFKALSTSQLRIESLNMFNSSGRRRRGLPCNALSNVDWDDEGLTESLSSLRSLSIGLSNRFFKFDEDEYGHAINYHDETDISMAQDEKNFTGLASLFKILKNLNSFELYYFTLGGELPDTDWPLQHLVALNSLPNLTRCKLRGIYATETDLLAFIKRTRVSHLYLEEVKLSSGSFRSIFDYCTSAESPISKLDFNVLYEKDREPSPKVVFLDTEATMLEYGAQGLRSDFLIRNGDDINQPISYNTDLRFPIGLCSRYTALA